MFIRINWTVNAFVAPLVRSRCFFLLFIINFVCAWKGICVYGSRVPMSNSIKCTVKMVKFVNSTPVSLHVSGDGCYFDVIWMQYEAYSIHTHSENKIQKEIGVQSACAGCQWALRLCACVQCTFYGSILRLPSTNDSIVNQLNYYLFNMYI